MTFAEHQLPVLEAAVRDVRQGRVQPYRVSKKKKKSRSGSGSGSVLSPLPATTPTTPRQSPSNPSRLLTLLPSPQVPLQPVRRPGPRDVPGGARVRAQEVRFRVSCVRQGGRERPGCPPRVPAAEEGAARVRPCWRHEVEEEGGTGVELRQVSSVQGRKSRQGES